MSEHDAQLDDLIAKYLEHVDDGNMIDAAQFAADCPAELRASFLKYVKLADGLNRLYDLQGGGQVDSCGEEVVGNYRLLRVISHGGMGIVYVGEDTQSGDLVAIKLLRRAIRNEQTFRRRLQRESRAIAALKHPHVVQPIASGIGAGATYFAMELIDGVGLDRVIQHWRPENVDDSSATTLVGEVETVTTPITRSDIASCAAYFEEDRLTKIAELLANIADALHAAHERGIVHRDVKPSNILIDVHGDIWLTDFGLASMGEDENDLTLTETGEVLGTPAYMSPEQASGKRGEIDRSTDIYSLGATLYELATLKRPFSGTRQKIIHDLLSGRFTLPSKVDTDVPPELEAIICHAMELQRRDRYATAADFAADLRRFATHARIHAPIRGPIHDALRWCARNPRMTILAVAGCVLISMVAISVQALNSWTLSRLNAELNATNDQLSTANRELDASQARLRRELYAANLSSAFEAYNDRDLLTVKRQLQPYAPDESDVPRSLPQRLLEALTESPKSQVLCRHEGAATQIAVADDYSFVLSAGHDGQVIQSTLDGEVVKRFAIGGKLDSLAIDARAGAFLAGRNLPAGLNPVDSYSLEDGKLDHEGVKFTYGVEEIAISPSGNWYAAAERYNDLVVFGKGEEERARWNTNSRNESIVFIDDDHLLGIDRAEDGLRGVFLWDIKSGKKQQIIHDAQSFAVSRDANGTPLCVLGGGNNDLRVYHWKSKECTPFFIDLPSRVRCIDIRAKDRLVVVGCDDGTVYVWESIRDLRNPPLPDRVVQVSDQRITDIQLLSPVRSPADSKPTSRRLSASKVRFLTSSEDGTVQLHSLPDRNPSVPPTLAAMDRGTLEDPFRDPQSSTLLYLPFENGELICLDVETLQTKTVYRHDEKITRGLCGGDRVYLASSQGVFEIDPQQSLPLREWNFPRSESRNHALMIIEDTLFALYTDFLVSIALKDGNEVHVSKLPYDGGFKLMETGIPAAPLRIFTQRALLELQSDGEIQVLKVTESAKEAYGCVQFSHDQKMQAIARSTDEIEVTDLRTGATWNLSGHRHEVGCLEFIDNDTALISVSQDQTIRFWSLETERELGRLTLDGVFPTHAYYFPDQNTIVSINRAGEVRVWRVADP